MTRCPFCHRMTKIWHSGTRLGLASNCSNCSRLVTVETDQGVGKRPRQYGGWQPYLVPQTGKTFRRQGDAEIEPMAEQTKPRTPKKIEWPPVALDPSKEPKKAKEK